MNAQDAQRAATGITGLDEILGGGFTPHRLYLVEGMPGSGKTTLAFQFLLEGARLGEPVLYITLSETEEEIRAVAQSHGWALDGVRIREFMPSERSLDADAQYTVFHPTEIELSETTAKILAEIDAAQAARVAIDSLSEMRLLSGSALRYRRQILAMKQFFAGRRCTVLMLDDLTSSQADLQVQSIAHGALMLEHTTPTYGTMRRRLSVTKLRGSDFRTGFHDYVIRRGGLDVYPRLVAAEHRQPSSRERLRSGIAGIDAMLGGGVERGTSTLVQGAAGTGKSTIAGVFASEAANRGECAALFIFDESANTLIKRMEGLGIRFADHVDSGRILVRPVDPAELSPGEFVDAVRRAVANGAKMVVIDSLNGYLNSMPDENFLVAQLHELLMYLGQHGVATILIAAQHGLFSSQMSSPVDASYLADTVLLLRFFEADGEVKQAVSVIKMRSGQHERSIREFDMSSGKVRVGEPLRHYRGVLTGVPREIPQP